MVSGLTEKQAKILMVILERGENERKDVSTIKKELDKRGDDIHINTVRKNIKGKFRDKSLIEANKETYGGKDYFKASKKFDRDTFKKIAGYMLDTSEKINFINSDYAQSIIENSVDYFATKWAKTYVEVRENISEEREAVTKQESFITIGEMHHKINYESEDLTDEDFQEWFYNSFQELNKEELLVILKTSPSALENLLFPKPLLEEQGLIRFVAMDNYFLYPFIMDIIRYTSPSERKLETELNLEYSDVSQEEVCKLIDVNSELNLNT